MIQELIRARRVESNEQRAGHNIISDKMLTKFKAELGADTCYTVMATG